MPTTTSQRTRFIPVLLVALAAAPLIAAAPQPSPAGDLAELKSELTALVAWKGVATAIERSDAPERCAALFRSRPPGIVTRLDYVLTRGGGAALETACVFATTSGEGRSWRIAPRSLLDRHTN